MYQSEINVSCTPETVHTATGASEEECAAAAKAWWTLREFKFSHNSRLLGYYVLDEQGRLLYIGEPEEVLDEDTPDQKPEASQ